MRIRDLPSTRRAVRLGTVLASCCLAGCAGRSAQPTLPVARSAAEQPLIPGDAVRVQLSLEPQLSGEYRVTEDGTLSLPLLGELNVREASAADLRRTIADGYSRQLRNQSIDIVLLRRIQVLGEVQSPGLYHVDPTMDLGDVVALAGGPTAAGEMERTRVIRGSEEIWDGQVVPTIDLHSGDQVLVPQKNWFVRHSTTLTLTFISTAAILLRGW